MAVARSLTSSQTTSFPLYKGIYKINLLGFFEDRELGDKLKREMGAGLSADESGFILFIKIYEFLHNKLCTINFIVPRKR
jgi:hypothetical protein